jgi:hypothetical protein
MTAHYLTTLSGNIATLIRSKPFCPSGNSPVIRREKGKINQAIEL